MKKLISALCVSLFLTAPAMSQDALTVGRIHRGEITANDVQPATGIYIDCYTLDLRAGTKYAVDVAADAFNPDLIVTDEPTVPECSLPSEGIEGRGLKTISYVTFVAEGPAKVTVIVLAPLFAPPNNNIGRYSLRVTTDNDRRVRIIPRLLL